MTTFFKNEETDQRFNTWISNDPESAHLNDRERFHGFILSLLESGEELSENILKAAIKSKKDWTSEEFIEKFIDKTMDKYYLMNEFYNFMKGKGRI